MAKTTKQNCWEFKKCGREPEGKRAAEFGVCPAALPNLKLNGLNNGKEGGRICWAVAGTMCGDKIQGDFARKNVSCLGCDFFALVKSEEGYKFCLLLPGQTYRPHKK